MNLQFDLVEKQNSVELGINEMQQYQHECYQAPKSLKAMGMHI